MSVHPISCGWAATVTGGWPARTCCSDAFSPIATISRDDANLSDPDRITIRAAHFGLRKFRKPVPLSGITLLREALYATKLTYPTLLTWYRAAAMASQLGKAHPLETACCICSTV